MFRLFAGEDFFPLSFLTVPVPSSCPKEIPYSNSSENYLRPMTFSRNILVKGVDIAIQTNQCSFCFFCCSLVNLHFTITELQWRGINWINFSHLPSYSLQWIAGIYDFPCCTDVLSTAWRVTDGFEPGSFQPHSMCLSSLTGTNNTQSILICLIHAFQDAVISFPGWTCLVIMYVELLPLPPNPSAFFRIHRITKVGYSFWIFFLRQGKQKCIWY